MSEANEPSFTVPFPSAQLFGFETKIFRGEVEFWHMGIFWGGEGGGGREK